MHRRLLVPPLCMYIDLSCSPCASARTAGGASSALRSFCVKLNAGKELMHCCRVLLAEQPWQLARLARQAPDGQTTLVDDGLLSQLVAMDFAPERAARALASTRNAGE
jgi:hypothetical protein